MLEKLVGRRYANLELLKNDIELLTKRNVKSIIESESDRLEECDFMIDFCFEDNGTLIQFIISKITQVSITLQKCSKCVFLMDWR